MSIFKDSFHPSIKDQLKKRQEIMTTRTPQNLQYFNSRNAWIRLSSSVNVYKGPVSASQADLQNPANYDNVLANKYVLQGGILNDGKLRAGLGDFSNAYSNVGADGEAYRLGIRPMPGITGVDIKNKGAYGSLRAATVTFQCWDIKQLEDLELLYMRPGYTLLLEWGWSPYIDNTGKYTTTLDFTDIINTEWTKENLFKRQYARATDGHYIDEKGNKTDIIGYEGNADSMFGLVKNYSWKARMDGGYDCSTEIISMGEVIESLKVNYSPLNAKADIGTNGLVSPNISGSTISTSDMKDLKKSYTQNVLAGIFYEMWEIGQQATGNGTNTKGVWIQVTDSFYKSTYDLFRVTINIKNGDAEASGTGTIGKSDEQIYITLETLCSLLNNYVLLRDKKSSDANNGESRPFAPLSVKENEYATTDTSGSGYLLALAHPLQVSVDPTVCAIKSNLWANGLKFKLSSPSSVDPNTGKPVIQFNSNISNPQGFVDRLISIIAPTSKISEDGKKELASVIKTTIQGTSGANNQDQINENVKEVSRLYLERLNDSNYKVGRPSDYDITKFGLTVNNAKVSQTINFAVGSANLFKFLKDGQGANLDDNVIKEILTEKGVEIAKGDPVKDAQDEIDKKNEELKDQADKGAEGYKYLKNLSMPYFVNDDYNTELGIIGHIYVNLNMLYNLSVSDDLASQDKKEKKEIAVYDFIKTILQKISAAIGEVNNFDIFVEPDTNVARIIDINYVDRKSQTEAYDNAFQIEVHNLNSVVRSYSLESKIFQEQASIVAIGAQVGGGALGIDTTTLVAFNKSIRDRIIPIKDAPTSPPIDEDPNLQLDKLTSSLSTLYTLGSDLKSTWYGADGKFDTAEAGKYEGALKDLLAFFKALGKSKTKNRAILPTVLSLDMDGIGGMIIGNLFKINADILPKGYKSGDNGGIGPKLGYLVNDIGHSIKNNDWVTKIQAQTIILDEPEGLYIDFEALTVTDESGETEVTIDTDTNGKSAKKPIIKTGKVTKSMTTFREVATAVIANLEGGYFHPSMLKDGRLNDKTGYMAGIDPKTGNKIPGISPSGETIFGIDRVNGSDDRESAPEAWDALWKYIADNKGPSTWKYNFPINPKGDPAVVSKLYELTCQIMEPVFNKFLNRYVKNKEIQNVIKSDGRLYFNFVYAVWNGPGWFKGWAKELTAEYDKGTKDSEQLATWFVRRRIDNSYLLGSKQSNNVLIAQSGKKISTLTGLA